ncbi:MAG: ACP S-malonyltransferase [Methylotenera sp.]|uniref:ACP S-malonyltransferase n=1 Tax=Methylotenera sp. TaxID=2051956 RepID=UPI00271C1757|nr:ACP S-malonyltransferase [Methylotenera sp.]MDO9204682.1 ACP S-malonyltransferase [Methylotenera sp.]MDO9394614.1 ACP S-malonyltransferase [Methylotenera sp.]MDP1522860.1 ACP S-malonyltransferase [Methylotenera sp.]MDP2231733.1 ACP S-malonyltransferase [Methylotenera sp.]MDP3141716.1 ACP S-malonyltransferase [Methylotenera sp.]
MKKLAFLFPGQGSQSVGMMAGFGDSGIIRNTFTEASDILGLDFWAMSTEPNESINETTNTQPIMLIAGVATWRAWQATTGKLPSVLAGHSLGEYTALVASGAISFAEALPLVSYRAEVMQSAVPAGVGAMAAILGLDDDAVRAVCAEAALSEVLEAVNFNSPGQVVIAGNKTAVERGMELAKAKGAKRALPLPVSVPSHCALMKPAAVKLAEYLKNVTILTPQIPVMQNADVVAFQDGDKIKDALVRQLYSPVRWVETVQAIHAQGVTQAAECGPGKVLAGLTKRIVAELPCVALTNNEALFDLQGQL